MAFKDPPPPSPLPSGIGAIKEIRHLFSQVTLYYLKYIKLWYGYTLANTVSGNCGMNLCNKVQKLQNRAAHVLTYLNYDVDAGSKLS